MIEANNQDIDIAALERRIQLELRQPERALAPPAPDKAGAAALPVFSPSSFQRLKFRLRAVPVLGRQLAFLNGWRRKIQARLLTLPYLGYGLRWLKSLALVHETRGIAAALVEDQQVLRAEISNVEQRFTTALELSTLHLNLLKAEVSNVEQRFNTALELSTLHLNLLKAEVGNVEQRFNTGLELNDARLAALGHEVSGAKELIAANRSEVLFQQRRLNSLLAQGVAPVSSDAQPPKQAVSHSGLLDNYYAAFEAAFRGSRQEIKSRLTVYLELIGQPVNNLPVLDIGCGRGEWIELLGERGIQAYGVDMNSVFTAAARESGLDVRDAEALSYLRGLKDASLAGVTGFHIIEHLELNDLIGVIDEANRVLAPGGFLLFETPNAENLIVGASTFWNDPTHRAPIPPSVARFIVEQRGFISTEIIYLNAANDALKLPGTDAISQRLNQLLYGPQDYAIWARKV